MNRARGRAGGRRGGGRALLAALVGVLVLTACGIGTDDTPRDINAPARQDNAGDNGQTAITAANTSVIYLVGHNDSGRFVLAPIARDVTETIDNALAALFDGPTPRELSADLHTAIPPSTRLLSATPNNDIVTVDVTSSLAQLTGATLIDAVGQIVLTATDVTGVSGVVITISDVMHPWPTPDGKLTTDPLTRDDFATLLGGSGVKATDPTVAATLPATVPIPTTVPATTVPATTVAAPPAPVTVTSTATPTEPPTAAPPAPSAETFAPPDTGAAPQSTSL